MAERLEIDLVKRLEDFRLAVRLTVATEILVMFGPSGAGKSQTLNSLAGLMRPDHGRIRLDGRWLFRREAEGERIDLPARERRMAMVFQQYALFPHLTARQNIAYPLRRKGDKRAAELLGRLQLESLADRYPHELSGGQQQRVAIARALAANARVLLLDEPFSALDRPIREQLHRELLTLQQENGLVVIYVTHDLEDAHATADRVAIIDRGEIVQVASLSGLFRQPRHRRILEILGAPNIFSGRADGDGIEWAGQWLRLGTPPESGSTRSNGERCGYIAAEDIEVIPSADEEAAAGRRENLIRGMVVRAHSTGRSQRVWIELANRAVVEAAVRNENEHRSGDSVLVYLPPDRLILTKESSRGVCEATTP